MNSNGRTGHVLLVEDDTELRESLQELIESEGYAVSTAGDGQQAIDVIETMEPGPDLVLLDLMMPVMDGWTFLGVRRSSPRLGACPVVLLSGVADLQQDPVVNMVDGCLVKPIDIDRLFEVLAEHCAAA